MINKDKFFEILEYLQEIDKFENDFRKLLNTTSRDTNFIYAAAFNDGTLINYLIDLLENEFMDTSNKWISYGICELNFGRWWKPGIVTYQNKDIKLQTKEDLYNFLMNNIMDQTYAGGTD